MTTMDTVGHTLTSCYADLISSNFIRAEISDCVKLLSVQWIVLAYQAMVVAVKGLLHLFAAGFTYGRPGWLGITCSASSG